MVLAASIGAIACTDGAKSSRGGADAAVTNGPGPDGVDLAQRPPGDLAGADLAGPPSSFPPYSGPPVLYVVSDNFWLVDPTGLSGSLGGFAWNPYAQLDPPIITELAADAAGHLYGVTATQLIAMDVGPPPTRNVVGNTGSTLEAMSFAPKGTIDPSQEVLVGFNTAGDYVRLDLSTGAATAIKPNALGGRPAGDITNVGMTGYVVLQTGELFTLDWATGDLGPSLGKFPTTVPCNALAHWGGVLYAFANPDQLFKAQPNDPAGATPIPGPAFFFDIFYRGAASPTSAPTQ